MQKLFFVLVGCFVGSTFLGGAAQAQSAGASVHRSSDSSSIDREALQRDGLFAGFSFGRGSIDVDCGDCRSGGGTLNEALSLEGHVGYMLTPRLALVGEHWTVRFNARGNDLFKDTAPHLVAQHISSIGAQLFLGNNLWIRSGLGRGWHVSDGDYTKRLGPSGQQQTLGTEADGDKNSSERPPLEALPGAGFSYYAAIGWEVAHNRSFAAEIQLRAASTRRTDNAYVVRNIGLNVGASWY